MDYKAYANPESATIYEDIPDLYLCKLKENDTSFEGLPLPKYEKFRDLLTQMRDSDNTQNEQYSVFVIDRFNKKITNFYRKKRKAQRIEMFFEFKTVDFLISHTSKNYSINICNAALSAISPFIVVYPELTNIFISRGFIDILNMIFQSSNKPENRILLLPAFKIFGHVIQNYIRYQFEYNYLKTFLNAIKFDGFIYSCKVIDRNDIYAVNFAIYNIFKQSFEPKMSENYILFPQPLIIEFLTILNETICSKISEETAVNYTHLYALNAINLFIRTSLYPEEIRVEGIIESSIQKCVNRYFTVDNLAAEKCIALHIISFFHQLGIPDTYECFKYTMPLLEAVIQFVEPNDKMVRGICDDIHEFLDSRSNMIVMQYFYSTDVLNKLANIFEMPLNYKKKSLIFGVIAHLGVLNMTIINSIPFNDFFLTERCVSIILEFLDDEVNRFTLSALMLINFIFGACKEKGTENKLNEFVVMNDGIDTVGKFIENGDDEISSYAMLVHGRMQSLMEKNENNDYNF